jgi:pyruvate kinase
MILFIAAPLLVTGISAQERIMMDDGYIVSVVIEAAGTTENLTFANHTNSTDEGNWIQLERRKLYKLYEEWKKCYYYYKSEIDK